MFSLQQSKSGKIKKIDLNPVSTLITLGVKKTAQSVSRASVWTTRCVALHVLALGFIVSSSSIPTGPVPGEGGPEKRDGVSPPYSCS